MKFMLARDWKLLDRTIGRLYGDIDETSWVSYTGEDVVRKPGEKKVYGQTAIPAGTYKISLTYSNRFKRILPEIHNVPGFTGIRVHGAKPTVPVEFSTLGCVCVGMTHDSEGVYDCTAALNKVIDLLKSAEQRKEESTITVA